MAKTVDITVRAKTVAVFGSTPTDRLVKAWLEERGISPTDVMGYRITRSSHGLPTIELTMHYSEEEAVTDDGVPS